MAAEIVVQAFVKALHRQPLTAAEAAAARDAIEAVAPEPVTI